MAIDDVTKKLLAYQTLHRLNRSFTSIVLHCDDLAALLPAKQVRLFRDLASELQANLNFHVTASLNSAEQRDWFRFGKSKDGK